VREKWAEMKIWEDRRQNWRQRTSNLVMGKTLRLVSRRTTVLSRYSPGSIGLYNAVLAASIDVRVAHSEVKQYAMCYRPKILLYKYTVRSKFKSS
jgi:hypothetical protein